MTAQLIKLNSLDLNASNIWADPDDSNNFDYSDGADEEHYLIDVLDNAKDITLESAELRRASRDWVSAYHLSAVRANLLRAINFSSNAKLLEVGCGCGALTRYLGEQGHCVDAVEGSATRAEITALRCRDLENVRIIQHNFNTLELPQGHYDAVLFIGVLEYARRFIDNPDITSEQAVISLIKKAAASLSNDGVIIVAIENRTGLKYINGAYEDHLALPDVGINNYQGYEFTGIKTYDRQQWQTIIAATGLKHRLFFPFGDYKFPNLVINAGVDGDDITFLSNQMYSQDPISTWVSPPGENQQWSNVLATGSLGISSNSFGLVIANSRPLDAIFKNKWMLFDKLELKPEFRVDVSNKSRASHSTNSNALQQVISDMSSHVHALSALWQQRISDTPTIETLMQLTSELMKLIKQCWPQKKLVDYDQLYISKNHDELDNARYWLMRTSITAEQQLFHFLLGIFKAIQKQLSRYSAFNFTRLSELIRACLLQDDLAAANTANLADFEDRFRNRIHICPTAVNDDLAYIISCQDKYQFRHINTVVFWSEQAEIFAADKSICKRIKQTVMPQTLVFEGIDSANRHLRFDPCDHEYGHKHYFCLHSIRVTNTQNHTILDLNDKSLYETLSGSHDLDPVMESKLIFKVSGIDSQIKFSLPADLSKITNRYNLEIKLQWLGI